MGNVKNHIERDRKILEIYGLTLERRSNLNNSRNKKLSEKI